MTNKRKLLLMTKLTLYENKHGKKDMKAAQYHQNDYVYLKNVPTRIAAGLGAVIVITLIWAHRIIVGGLDILTIDYRQELIRMGVYIIVVLAAYTLIGTIKSSIEYNKAVKRINKYMGQLNQLEQIRKHEQELKEGAYTDGTDVYYPRRHY